MAVEVDIDVAYLKSEIKRTYAQVSQEPDTDFICPICFSSKKLDEAELVSNARLAGATPLWEWIGDGATVFSY